MKCPDQGQLLLFVEKELSPDDNKSIIAHLAACPLCSRAVEQVQYNLAFSSDKLSLLIPSSPDVQMFGQDDVWRSIQHRLKANTNDKRRLSIMRLKKIAATAAVVMALVLVGSIPGVQTAAANFLQVFRVQKVDTVIFTPGDMASIEQALNQGNGSLNLDCFGKIETVGKDEKISLGTGDLANLGFAVKFPANLKESEAVCSLEKIPVMQIAPDVKKVNVFIQSLGSTNLLPESLDGQTFSIKMGDTLTIDCPNYSLYQGKAPQLEVPAGVEVKEVARTLVSLPIWPDNIKRQLEAINDWEHTLVIPGENSQKVNVNGQDGILLSENNHRILIWQENGMLYFLQNKAGNNSDLVEIAQSLR